MDRIHGLREIADDFDGFIFDVWGTLYDGGAAFEQAVSSLQALRDLGKRIAILSNSPQRPGTVAGRLDRIGITADLYDGIVTSGGVTHDLLIKRTGPFSDLGERVFQTGPVRFPETLPDRGYISVDRVAAADWILCSGPDEPMATLQSFDPMLDAAIAAGVPMVCANPDLEVVQQGKRQICAGAIAKAYADRGGRVVSIGKPHPEVFERSMSILEIDTPSRCLMIGDNLSTDVLGAARAGLASLLLTQGIHAEHLGPTPAMSAVEDLSSELKLRQPTYVDHAIAWSVAPNAG